MWANVPKCVGWVYWWCIAVVVLSVAVVNAGTLTGTLEGNLVINNTATVNQNLKVNTSTSPGTPNFITGNNGDAYIKDQLEVDGNVSVDGYVLHVNTVSNTVGIGNPAGSYDKLTLYSGALAIYEQSSDPWDEADLAKIYSKQVSEAEMFTMDGNGTTTQISSHIPPSVFNSSVTSSFDESDVIIPFSFHHGNKYIGKGAVVDLAALVADTEKRYGKSYTTDYDLPTGETETLEARQSRLELLAKQRILSQTPEVEIPIQEAWVEAEIQKPVETTRSITKYHYDLTTEQVTAYQVEEKVTEMAGTGQSERQLKEGVRFDEATGKFYRQRKVEDVNLPADAVPPLPDWILSRVPKTSH